MRCKSVNETVQVVWLLLDNLFKPYRVKVVGFIFFYWV